MNVRFDPRYSTYEKQFAEQPNYYKRALYMQRKIKTFSEVWINFFINPIKLEPNIVRKYDRLDMSKFWAWLKENKEDLNKKQILATLKIYKNKLDELNKRFNLNINDFM